jgi:hypothetical protein
MQESIMPQLISFAEVFRRFCGVISGESPLPGEEILESELLNGNDVLSVFEAVSMGLGSLVSAYGRQTTGVYTNFECVSKLAYIRSLIEIWDRRLTTVQETESHAKNIKGWQVVGALITELSSWRQKLETLSICMQRLDFTHIRATIQPALSFWSNDVRTLLARLDFYASMEDCRELVFEKESLTYRIRRLCHNANLLTSYFNVNVP